MSKKLKSVYASKIAIFTSGVVLGAFALSMNTASAQNDHFIEFLKAVEENCSVATTVRVEVEVSIESGFFSKAKYGYGAGQGRGEGNISCN